MNKHMVYGLLADKPVAYRPDIARVCGSVKAGVFFSQLLFWSDLGARSDGYIWKTQADWEKETALSRYEQESARKQLRKRGFIHEKRMGVPAKLYYRADLDKVIDSLVEFYSMQESRIQGCREPTIKDAENLQSTTKNTTENTTEKKREARLIPEDFENLNVPEFLEIWADWRRYKKSKIKVMSYNRQLKKADKMAAEHGISAVCGIFDDSITNGWAGLFWKNIESKATAVTNTPFTILWNTEADPYLSGNLAFSDLSDLSQTVLRQMNGDTNKAKESDTPWLRRQFVARCAAV